MRRAFLLMLLALSGPGRAAPPITKTQVRSLPADETKRRVLAQLSDLLVMDAPAANSTGHKPKHPLDDLWFYTRPHGTATRGVCVSSIVTVRFRAVDDGPRDADTPVRPSDIEVSAQYHLLRHVEPKDLDELDSDGQLRADRQCAALDPRTMSTITARDEETLVTGLWLLRQAKAAIGTPKMPAMACEGYKQSCETVLAAIDPARVSSVSTCPEAPRNNRCYEVEADDTAAEIHVDADDHITSINLGQEIIIADLRED
jgi:hypothetical protein